MALPWHYGRSYAVKQMLLVWLLPQLPILQVVIQQVRLCDLLTPVCATVTYIPAGVIATTVVQV